MTSIRRWCLAGLLVFGVVAVVGALEVPVYAGSGVQRAPDIDGGCVVWQDDSGSPDIYLADLASGTQRAVAAEPLVPETDPAISGRMIVYVALVGTEYQVRVYDRNKESTATIATSVQPIRQPDIWYSSGTSGTTLEVAWEEANKAGAGYSDIYLYRYRDNGYELPSTTTGRISTNPESTRPSVDGDLVVWQGAVGEPDEDRNHEIYLYRVTDETETPLTDSPAMDLYPVVSGTRVAWYSSLFGERTEGSVNVYQVDAGTTTTIADSISFMSFYGEGRQIGLSGDAVVYGDLPDSPSGPHLYLHDLASGFTRRITTTSNYAGGVAIGGAGIVWHDARGDGDIYRFDDVATPITSCIRITEPGLYFLQNDIVNSGCTYAIEILSPGVILEGNGHTVDGIDSTDTSVGVSICTPLDERGPVVVRNLRLTDWDWGVDVYGMCRGIVLSGVTATSNRVGLQARLGNADETVIERCSASGNSETGLLVQGGSTVAAVASVFDDNGKNGVMLDSIADIRIEGCRVSGNGFDPAVVSERNDFFMRSGIWGYDGRAEVRNSTISGNQGPGIAFLDADGDGWPITGNQIVGNGYGYYETTRPIYGEVRGGNHVIYNNVFSNTRNVATNLSNTWNLKKGWGPNIIGGPYTGGNYWGPTGTGFSSTHPDTDGDGFSQVACSVNTQAPPVLLAGGQNLDRYPLTNTTGISLVLVILPGAANLPLDLDEDSIYEDVNGNGRTDFADVVLYFNQMAWIATNEPVSSFDYNANGRIDFNDVVMLFTTL